MKNNPRPGIIMLIAGGAVLFLASLLKWVSFHGAGGSGVSTDWAPGLIGLWCLIIGGATAVLVAITTFAGVNLPARVVGFTWNQIYLIFGIAAFLITFGRQFASNVGIGVTLGWIASAVIVAGAFMEMQHEGRPSSTPPTSF